ncbi:nucleolar protein 7 isoform X2 [Ochotona curzoniae]|uniref:nucleolar protein 7 isoform X2 n=1 Tax=Ochotona curzoniae TaxID=130825 RepID=UPI001B34727B|nr:nucleolar protein 7 isoform X2 [Ochotona curzoniae]
MVQLRPRPSRTPAPAEAMVDEGQAASEEEEAELGLRLGQPSSGAAAEPLEEDEDADGEWDDEAPDELTFANAQAEAREEERRVRESARRDKALLKERRKRREELFIEQKKRKLLPDAILEQLAAAPQATVKKLPGKQKEANLQKKKEEREKESDSKKVKVQKIQSASQNKSYVALRLKDQELRDARQQAAKAFLQQALYGPGTRRTTVNKFLSLDNKRSAVKKAAAQFLNDTWGTQRKQNAKKFKRRWMVRKMKTAKK